MDILNLIPTDKIKEEYSFYFKDIRLFDFSLDGIYVDDIYNYGNIGFIPLELMPYMMPNFVFSSRAIIAFNEWLKERAIDINRINARKIIKQLKLNDNRRNITLKNKALNLTDHYWVSKKDISEVYEHNCLYTTNNDYYTIFMSLSGEESELDASKINTELTNIGSFNKTWYKEYNQWYLVKSGTKYNYYAELFAYYLGKLLNFNMAEYRMITLNSSPYIASKNFTNNEVYLEHYSSVAGFFADIEFEDETIVKNMTKLTGSKEILDILFLDALICNGDRHSRNFGILRNCETGNIEGTAPNFDNNLAFNTGNGKFNVSGFNQLKMFLNELDQDSKYLTLLNTITIEGIKNIDEKVKLELGLVGISIETNEIIDYFEKIFDYYINK